MRPSVWAPGQVHVCFDRYQRLLGRPAGSPLDLVQPESMRYKVAEPILLLGKQRFANVDIRIRVKGGGRVSQIYGRTRPAPTSLASQGLCQDHLAA